MLVLAGCIAVAPWYLDLLALADVVGANLHMPVEMCPRNAAPVLALPSLFADSRSLLVRLCQLACNRVCVPPAVEGMGETDATIRLMPGMDWTSQLGLSSGPSAQ